MPEEQKPDQFKEFAEKVLSSLEGLNERIGTVETSVSEQLTANTKSIQESVKPPTVDKAAPTLADMDLESMSRTDFANAITQSVVSAVKDQLVTPMAEQVGKVQNSTEMQNLRTEFNDVADRHDDFGLYKEAMTGMVETHSHLSVEEMYTIAKANNPDIATQAASEEAEANPQPNKDDAFGGLTPTSGSTIMNKGESSVEDAANSAWDDTMAGTPLAETQ